MFNYFCDDEPSIEPIGLFLVWSKIEIYQGIVQRACQTLNQAKPPEIFEE